MVRKKETVVILRPKRQVTLPREICERLGIKPGDVLELTVENSSLVAKPRKARSLEALKTIHDAGIRTWASMEPVIFPDQSLEIMELTKGFVDYYKIGKLNHMPKHEMKFDWPKFLFDAVGVMRKNGSAFYIKKDLLKISGVDINNVRDRITPLSKSYFELKDFILSELSFIRDIDIYKNEIELLNQIEDFKWGMNPGDYARSRRPQLAFVQNPYELNKGLSTPPHIVVGGEIIFAFSLLASYDNFEKLAHRLIRQLEIKSSTSAEAEAGAVFQQQALLAIIEKFHSVATQFRNRYDSRPTITINDEYDVQDLMNGLLCINFEDVRKEEYTPSYAGGSTRVDFLLKREKILIEVKKTRATLKDKDIGNQLIVDIAHYKSHPDCKQLICFVYDPDNFVANPRGLEDDLKRLSSEEMLVEVYIRP